MLVAHGALRSHRTLVVGVARRLSWVRVFADKGGCVSYSNVGISSQGAGYLIFVTAPDSAPLPGASRASP